MVATELETGASPHDAATHSVPEAPPTGPLRSPTILSRRAFATGLVGVAAAAFLLPGGRAWATANSRSVTMHHAHRQEHVEVAYWHDGWYDPDALASINYFMRDNRNETLMQMDPGLVDIVSAIQGILGTSAPVHLVSGYRSPETNAYLAARSRGVARNSYHMYGRAADIRAPFTSLATLRQTAMALQGGGVGYYPSSDFVHVDTGPVRNW